MSLITEWEMTWKGWTLTVNGIEIGRIEPDGVNGYRLHLNESNPPIGWSYLMSESVQEAQIDLEDYALALRDLVEMGESEFEDGEFKPTPVVWSP